jgi:tetratricopeptide (TPR) repeat protein
LIGGIAGLTIAKAGDFKVLLDKFAVGPNPGEFPLMASAAIFYVGLGFFFMFFQRELILNVVLAEKRSERVRWEGSREAGQIIQRFLVRLPASVLSGGVVNIDQIADVNAEEAESLNQLLNSEEVNNFLSEAEAASKAGSLEWDIVSKTAYIYYYRTYFQEEKERVGEINKALEWLSRALNINPLHVDLTMKYADMVAAKGEEENAVAILERLVLRPEAPVLVKKWLGYYLLFLSDREKDAIHYSEDFLTHFFEDADARFNIACGYAQLYCAELVAQRRNSNPESDNRRKALESLREGLARYPKHIKTARSEWTKKGESFECLATDRDFLALVDETSVN